MSPGDKGKRILVHQSSSDDEQSEEDFEPSDEDDDGELDDDDYEDDDDNDDNDDYISDHSGSKNDDDDDEFLSNRVIQFLQGRKNLHELSIKACKAHLRRHGLRVSGTKDVCVHRIHEHWRIKDGKAEVLYPRSSFAINCTGDVCKGDTVLFTQKVYGSFDKKSRSGKLLGKRTVAGRVVKESYGAAKQQHTFTVEVLWCKGIRKLPPLFPFLVKGRNLYRLKTFRQPWQNEADRRDVLSEKHRRGSIARLQREKRKKALSTGGQSQKLSHISIKRGKREIEASSSKHVSANSTNRKQAATRFSVEAKISQQIPRHHKSFFPNHSIARLQPYRDARCQYSEPQRSTFYGSAPYGSNFLNNRSDFPYYSRMEAPQEQSKGFRCTPLLHNPYHIPSSWIPPTEYRQVLPGQRQKGSLKCSIRGCNEHGLDKCVIGACLRCCKREGLRCHVHR